MSYHPGTYAIVIPTVKLESELSPLVNEIQSSTIWMHDLVIQSNPQSHSCGENMNIAMARTSCPYIIKVDDDVSGFRHITGWDQWLLEPMLEDERVMVVGARLMNPDGSLQATCTYEQDVSAPVVDIARKMLPFCCVAFRNDGIRWDEQFLGTWCDDSDICCQWRMRRPDARFVIANRVRLYHRNEGKGRQHAQANGAYFGKKWGSTIFPDGQGLL